MTDTNTGAPGMFAQNMQYLCSRAVQVQVQVVTCVVLVDPPSTVLENGDKDPRKAKRGSMTFRVKGGVPPKQR